MNLFHGLGAEDLWHAVEQLRQHKLRTALTLLGMVFGVGAVIAMLSIGEGAKQEALRLIDKYDLKPEQYEFQMLLTALAGEQRRRAGQLHATSSSGCLVSKPSSTS